MTLSSNLKPATALLINTNTMKSLTTNMCYAISTAIFKCSGSIANTCSDIIEVTEHAYTTNSYTNFSFQHQDNLVDKFIYLALRLINLS